MVQRERGRAAAETGADDENCGVLMREDGWGGWRGGTFERRVMGGWEALVWGVFY